ncbi:MAG: Xaa-Pro peptidase family protein [Spirochaetes bacterium]|nr:Xaa-Pro peptidase family protein [Spirochaetota bacterium]
MDLDYPTPYAIRRQRVAREMQEQGVSILLLEDAEHLRDSSLRYLSGHPQDALLFLRSDGHSLLVPWDVHLANLYARVDEILPYNQFDRLLPQAVLGVLKHWGFNPSESFSIELVGQEPYVAVVELEQNLKREFPNGKILCRREGIHSYLEECRQIKSEEELTLLEKATNITNEILHSLEVLLSEERAISETEVALFIEIEARKRGAEGTSFQTIVAGPTRSFAIHAYPTFGSGLFKDPETPGLSIVDFGIFYEGYTSDVTFTLASGTLTARRRFLIDLVEEGYQKALSLCKPGMASWEIAEAVQDFFSRHSLTMPHSLGHGIGLEVHERPFFRVKKNGGAVLSPGMVVTIEPGLYEEGTGGVRLENDLLITETGHRVLTEARILYT